jgi:hypothetical protein
MRTKLLLLWTMLASAAPALSTTLTEVYDRAEPDCGYDKYVVLETGVTYTGGLWIGATFNRITAEFDDSGVDVCIVGNGAILDLQGTEICMAYCNNRLDIEDCVIVNGDVRFRGYDADGVTLVPQGSVRYVTFYKPHDYGVRLFGCGAGILIERNIVVDALDTGPDFQYLTGYLSDWLPTGPNFATSLTDPRELYDNWSYHSDPDVNADLLRHFVLMCNYG